MTRVHASGCGPPLQPGMAARPCMRPAASISGLGSRLTWCAPGPALKSLAPACCPNVRGSGARRASHLLGTRVLSKVLPRAPSIPHSQVAAHVLIRTFLMCTPADSVSPLQPFRVAACSAGNARPLTVPSHATNSALSQRQKTWFGHSPRAGAVARRQAGRAVQVQRVQAPGNADHILRSNEVGVAMRIRDQRSQQLPLVGAPSCGRRAV